MSIDETAARLDQYRERFRKGKVDEIKPKHVQKICDTLSRKRDQLDARLAAANNEPERQRLAEKRAVVDELIERAVWLRDQL